MNDEVALTEQDIDRLRAVDHQYQEALFKLGALLEQFEVTKDTLMNAANSTRTERETLIKAFSQSYLKGLEGKWVLDYSTMTFRRAE
jgi:prefoldin subunit 5